MRLLLDTHIFLWFTSQPAALEPAALALIEDAGNEVFLSAAVAWEISIKHARGKLTLPMDPRGYVISRMQATGMRDLPITQDHALATALLPNIHSDPFDRIMIAQAQLEGMTFVTRDEHALGYPVAALRG